MTTNLDVNSSLNQIYDENLVKYLEYTVEESKLIHKTQTSSVIMEYIKSDLNSIEESQLSPANRLKRKHLIRVIDVCAKMRITDSMNLKQVYDLFKSPNVKF